MTVGELKRKLERFINNLENYDDDKEVNMVSNTYFLGNAYYFLGVSGYDGGYIDLENPVEEDDEEDWDEEDEE